MTIPLVDFAVRFDAGRFAAELQAVMPDRIAQVWDDPASGNVVVEPEGAPLTSAEQATVLGLVPAHGGPFTQAERDAEKRTALRNFLGI